VQAGANAAKGRLFPWRGVPLRRTIRLVTGREKIQAALSGQGTGEFPAVICYEGIYYRDHWDALTSRPWWYVQSYDLDRQLAWLGEAFAATPQDWFALPVFPPRARRQATRIEQRPDGVYRVDRRAPAAERLRRPVVGGWDLQGLSRRVESPRLPETTDEVDRAIPPPQEFDAEGFLAAGRGDLAAALLEEFGKERFPMGYTTGPLWSGYGTWGFEGLMTLVAERPDLVERACRRNLAHCLLHVRRADALGAAGVWIEDCMTDLVSPAAFAELNVPFLQQLTGEIRRLGMKSVYYYCGDPADRWELLFSAGADAIALEEGKKGFVIDIEEAVDRAAGRCAVLGNLDAIGVLEGGSEADLRAEIARQLAAGRRNGGRFIMSLGSPVTPGTSTERVRRYLDLAHEIGRA